VARWFRERLAVAGPFGCRCLTSEPVLRFHFPLIEPDVQIYRIRLSDGLHRQAHGCHQAPFASRYSAFRNVRTANGADRPCGQSPGSPVASLACPKSGPFPPRTLLRFDSTMNLSDFPGGPAWPSRASGWVSLPPSGISRVASDLRVQTCRRHYPGGTVAGIASLPCPLRQRPSPCYGRVGSHIMLFEACSTFTRVTACLLAGPPNGPLHRRLRRYRYLHRRSDCYRLERNLPGGNCTH
jgi:hypothetical protein